MKLRIFLDTNVFIYAFEFPKSNSRKIIELLNEGKIEAVISERVIKEVQAYFLVSFDKDFKKFKEYKTPKIFIEDIGLIPNEEEF